MKPLIKDTPKEDKPPDKGQAESTLVYSLYKKSPLKEDSLSTKDKMAGPEGVLYYSICNVLMLIKQKNSEESVSVLSCWW